MSARRKRIDKVVSAKGRLLSSIRPAQFEFVCHIFSEGETELRYLSDISKSKCVKIVPVPCNTSSPPVLMQKARDWAYEHRDFFKGGRASDGASHVIWVLFDDDEKTVDIARTVSEFGCPPTGISKAKLKSYKPPKINVGYMKPCIELWGALCVKGDAKGLPYTHGRVESALSRIMKGYDHNSNRYFDVAQMVKTTEACKLAAQWEKTHGEFPKCVNATYFACIHRLVTLILSTSDR